MAALGLVAHGLSLALVSGATLWLQHRASHCGAFSCCRARAIECIACNTCSMGLRSRGPRVYLFHGTWHLWPGIKVVSSALAGAFLTAGPAGKSYLSVFPCLHSHWVFSVFPLSPPLPPVLEASVYWLWILMRLLGWGVGLAEWEGSRLGRGTSSWQSRYPRHEFSLVA